MDSSTGGETLQTSEVYFTKYLPLYIAALIGDWETANTVFFENNSQKAEVIISALDETALHVAVQSGRANDFVRKLVALMSPQAIALKNKYGQTALHEAAIVGNTEAAMAMLQKNPALLYMKSNEGKLPVIEAAGFCQKDILEYLISVSKTNVENSPFEGEVGFILLIVTITSHSFDVALDLVDKYPSLARLGWPNYKCPLAYMAEMESVFPSRQNFSWWEKLIYHGVPVKQHKWRSSTSVAGNIEDPTYKTSSTWLQIGKVREQLEYTIWKVVEHIVPGVKEIKEKKEMHEKVIKLAKYLCGEMKYIPNALGMLRDSITRAAKHGINEIVEMSLEMYPALTTYADDNNVSIMHLAASNRFENIFNLIYSMSDRRHRLAVALDSELNSLMHMAARLAPPARLNLVPGAALQMQRELQWFNEMGRVVPPSRRVSENKDGKTPKMLFTEEHKELKAEGERWMKDTANACAIATALIATVVFAAAFTVPGGVSSETGIPVLSKEPAFVLFATTNAVSLFTSITSLMMFLSILTSRYAEEDFLHVLPQRLSFGLLCLFISITFMLIAFSAALYLVFHKKLLWFMIPVAAFGWWPLASFVLLQFPLLFDVVYSTYGPGIFGKKTDRVFY